nr:MAG TPA: hypothetical protein [Caudoviricetes sp.]
MSASVTILLILILAAAVVIEMIALAIMTGAIIAILNFTEKIKGRKHNRSEKKK